MVALLLDPDVAQELIRRRRATGADRYDEVWDGVYVMSPAPDPLHQGLGGKLYIVLDEVIDGDGLGAAHFGVNVTDRFDDWTQSYRVPDLAVFLEGTAAEHSGPAFVGGPDFLIEVRSEDDRTWEKLPFYEKLGVRELLVIEREPWKLTLLRLIDGRLTPVGVSTESSPASLRSEVVPLSFQLAVNADGIALEIVHHDGIRRWRILPQQQRAVLVRLPPPRP